METAAIGVMSNAAAKVMSATLDSEPSVLTVLMLFIIVFLTLSGGQLFIVFVLVGHIRKSIDAMTASIGELIVILTGHGSRCDQNREILEKLKKAESERRYNRQFRRKIS